MESISEPQFIEPAAAAPADSVSTSVETTVEGKRQARRVTTTCKSRQSGELISVLVEEYQNEKLVLRQYKQFFPQASSTKEVYEADGSLVYAEIERGAEAGCLRRIIRRGSGKSATTRIICGEIEARATERSIIVEAPEASHNYQPFEGKWCSFYKNMSFKLELKSNFLKNPLREINGPDGIKLFFDENGQLADLIVNSSPSKGNGAASVPGIIE